jgi:hypothetical protein
MASVTGTDLELIRKKTARVRMRHLFFIERRVSVAIAIAIQRDGSSDSDRGAHFFEDVWMGVIRRARSLGRSASTGIREMECILPG